MNILLVEDNRIKQIAIERGLRMIRPDARIVHVNNLENAKKYINSNYELTDLVILDWCFPENRDGRITDGAGLMFLDYVKEHHLNTKTIICSSNELNDMSDDYRFIIGMIEFGTCNAATEIYNCYLDSVVKQYNALYDRPSVKTLGLKK